MDVFRPGSRESINQAGYFEKEFLGMEVAVKDSERYDDGWAYLSFRDRAGGLKASASAFPKEAVLRLSCGACRDGQRVHAVLPGVAGGGSRQTRCANASHHESQASATQQPPRAFLSTLFVLAKSGRDPERKALLRAPSARFTSVSILRGKVEALWSCEKPTPSCPGPGVPESPSTRRQFSNSRESPQTRGPYSPRSSCFAASR